MDFGVAFTGQKLLGYKKRKICDKLVDVTSGKRNNGSITTILIAAGSIKPIPIIVWLSHFDYTLSLLMLNNGIVRSAYQGCCNYYLANTIPV